MEKKSANTLSIKTMSDVVEEAKRYIKDRKDGKEKSLRVRSKAINDTFMDGFDWNRIVTVGGLGGAGKSTLIRQWIKDFIELNSEEDFDVLTFQFEMLGLDEVARDVSSKIKKSIKEIYSAGQSLKDTEFSEIETILDSMKHYPIYVVDNIGTVKNIYDTILYYITSNDLVNRRRGLVVTIDNTSLVLGDDTNEKETIDSLMYTLVLLKKYVSSIGGRIIFFVVSQLNRQIESNERVLNPQLHYPNKSDLFGASSVYNSSDYVVIIHRPCLIEGIGNWYGPPRKNWDSGLPVYNPNDPTQPMTYLHVIKERFGATKIIPMLDDLKNSMIADYPI